MALIFRQPTHGQRNERDGEGIWEKSEYKIKEPKETSPQIFSGSFAQVRYVLMQMIKVEVDR
jgi:hypothetical protein